MNKWMGIAALCVGTGFVQANEQPNVLWVITDDHRADSIAAYNRAMTGKSVSPLGFVMSPEADKLAAEGTLFTHAYCNSPACAPSRTSMHYGMYPFRSGHYGFETSHRDTPFKKQFAPEFMADLGYQTATFGKTGYYVFKNSPKKYEKIEFYQKEVGTKELDAAGLADWYKSVKWEDGKPSANGMRWNLDGGMVEVLIPLKGEMDAENKAKLARVENELDILYAYKRATPTMVIGGVSPKSTKQTTDGNIANSFIEFLDNAGKSYKAAHGKTMQGPDMDKPLFAHLGFHFPHTPTLPSKEFRDIFIAKEKEMPYKIPDFSKEELEKVPPQMKSWFEKTNFADMEEEDKLQTIRDYYAFCAMGDSLVGDSVDAFKAFSEKQGRDWLILYVIGDHGWHLGENGGTAKFAPYDYSNHGAVIAVSSDKSKWPAGKVVHDYVEYVDILPTMVKEGGADLTAEKYAHFDGFALDEVSNGTKKREYVIGEMNHLVGPRCYIRGKDFSFSMRNREKAGKPGEKFGEAVGANLDWALTAPREDVEMMLFDLRVDPLEQNNVAYDKKYQELADWFRVKLANISLGDGRVECDWKNPTDYVITDFAKGADDKVLNIPNKIIPKK